MDKIWSQQSSTSMQYKKRKTDQKSGREGFVRSVISGHPHTLHRLYYTQILSKQSGPPINNLNVK